MDPLPVPNSVAHLSPLILETTKLTWDNLVDSHSRWAEEVSSLCALAGSGVYASLQIPNHPLQPPPHPVTTPTSPSVRTSKHQKNEKGKKVKEKKVTFSEYDDHLARSIIILCMGRDIRERFSKLMKVANTSKKLFNGIAILKEAVAEGQAREREAGGYIPDAILHNIRMKALAMAEEIDWKSNTSSDSSSNVKHGILLFKIKSWTRRVRGNQTQGNEG